MIEGYGTGCGVLNCTYSGDTQIPFDAFAGSAYFIVVDGPGGAAGAFSLAMTCL